MSKLVVLVAVGGVLTLGDLALAGPLVTRTLFPGTATQVTCIVTNVGTKPADVTVQIVGAFSALAASQSTGTLPSLTNTQSPDRSQSAWWATPVAGASSAWRRPRAGR
jgi:hypothetical protein